MSCQIKNKSMIEAYYNKMTLIKHKESFLQNSNLI